MLIHEIAATQTDFNLEDLIEIEDGVSGVSKKGTLENIIRKIISENAPSRIIPGQFTLSYVGVTTFGVATGKVLNDTFVSVLDIPSAFTKTLSAWAVGTGNGALDTGAVAVNSSYDVYIIKNDITSVSDILICLRGNAPVMPADHTYKRYVGIINTNAASQIHDFYQIGNMFRFRAQKNDRAYGALANTNRALLTVSAPEGCIGIFTISGRNAGSSDYYAIIQATTETDSATSQANNNMMVYAQNAINTIIANILIDSSRQIAYRGDSANIYLRIGCDGWIDPLI